MSARTEVHAALMRAGYGAPGADRLLDLVEADAVARGSEKDTRGGSPQQGESTHRHTRPCEFPEVLCTCPRPRGLPDASFVRARRRARVGAYFAAVKQLQADLHRCPVELR